MNDINSSMRNSGYHSTLLRPNLVLWRKALFAFAIIYQFTITLWPFVFSGTNYFRLAYFALIAFGAIYGVLTLNRTPQIYISFLIYLVYILLSVLLISPEADLYASLYPYIFLPLVFFSAVYAVISNEYYGLIKTYIVISTIAACIAIFETISGQPVAELINPGYQYSYYVVNGQYVLRSSVFADSGLSLGCQFAVASILCLFMANKCHRLLWWVLLLINVIGLLTTGSRGPMVSCAAGIVILMAFGDCVFMGSSYSRLKALLVCLLPCIVILLIVLMIGDTNDSQNAVVHRVLSIFDWKNDAGNIERIKRWSQYIKIFIRRPFWGIGVGGCKYTGYGVAESGLLQRLVETGIVGTAIYLFMLSTIIFKGVFFLLSFSVSNSRKEIVLIGLSVGGALLTENLVLQIFESTIVGTLLWFSLGLVFFGTYISGSDFNKCDNRGI